MDWQAVLKQDEETDSHTARTNGLCLLAREVNSQVGHWGARGAPLLQQHHIASL